MERLPFEAAKTAEITEFIKRHYTEKKSAAWPPRPAILIRTEKPSGFAYEDLTSNVATYTVGNTLGEVIKEYGLGTGGDIYARLREGEIVERDGLFYRAMGDGISVDVPDWQRNPYPTLRPPSTPIQRGNRGNGLLKGMLVKVLSPDGSTKFRMKVPGTDKYAFYSELGLELPQQRKILRAGGQVRGKAPDEVLEIENLQDF